MTYMHDEIVTITFYAKEVREIKSLKRRQVVALDSKERPCTFFSACSLHKGLSLIKSTTGTLQCGPAAKRAVQVPYRT